MGMWLSIILVTGWFVFQDPRLQRFASLQDTDTLPVVLAGSVNANFGMAVLDYPMGNGIGAGGTSIPYFLADRTIESALDRERIRQNTARARPSRAGHLAGLHRLALHRRAKANTSSERTRTKTCLAAYGRLFRVGHDRDRLVNVDTAVRIHPVLCRLDHSLRIASRAGCSGRERRTCSPTGCSRSRFCRDDGRLIRRSSWAVKAVGSQQFPLAGSPV